MSSKKSKNNPMNRQGIQSNVCNDCDERIKTIRVVSPKYKGLGYMCGCGVKNKNKELIITEKELSND